MTAKPRAEVRGWVVVRPRGGLQSATLHETEYRAQRVAYRMNYWHTSKNDQEAGLIYRVARARLVVEGSDE